MSSLLIQEVPLMVLPTLATKIGLNEAMFLQQLHYWIDRSKHEMEGHRWIYNTIEDWCKQFPFWSRRTIVRVISSLERHGLVLTANYNRKGFDRTSLLLLSAPRYGIQEKTMRKYLQKFGLELVLKEFSLLKKLLEQKKPIQNPAGWLRCALEEQYADAGADLEKVRQEKQADIEAKNQARKEFYERQLREEQEKDRTEVDESNPFYGYFLRHCKQSGDKGTEENSQIHPVET